MTSETRMAWAIWQPVNDAVRKYFQDANTGKPFVKVRVTVEVV